MIIHEYLIKYDFDKESRSPGEIFRCMSDLSDGFGGIDALLLEAIGENLRSSTTLSGIEYGSILAKIAQLLRGIDDDNIGKLEWKKILGKMLVKSKWAIIKFLDKRSPATNADLIALQNELNEYQIETGIKNIPAYKPVQLNQIADKLVIINSATSNTTKTETIELNISGKSVILSSRQVITQERKIEILTTNVSRFKDKATVLIKKPDYLGNSMWDVIYGQHKESMQMGDIDYLVRFHQKDKDSVVLPGDSLEVDIDGTVSIGNNGETIHKRYVIRKVHRVIKIPDNQRSLFDI